MRNRGILGTLAVPNLIHRYTGLALAGSRYVHVVPWSPDIMTRYKHFVLVQKSRLDNILFLFCFSLINAPKYGQNQY